MYQALYRKYRPTLFSDVVGQDHITNTITGSLGAGKISHAYLFTGTRGTGKTTCAKILAQAVCCQNLKNGEPCGECEACKLISEGNVTDILEIDAASNNSVNDIRDLKEQVSFLPTSLKYRVYIIDEVHMLSIQAFNALLKTLEEPPAHVVFILATTEVHKLPATILSRCQRFDFKRLEPEVMIERMMYIANKEGFTLTDEAALMIASLADGGMRDALSILDQCSVGGINVDSQVIKDVCGIAGNERIFSLAEAINNNDAATAIGEIDALYRNSVDMKKLLFELVGCFRNLMMIKTVENPRGLIVCSKAEFDRLKDLAENFTLSRIIDSLTTLQETAEAITSTAARSDVELVIVKLCSPELGSSVSGLKLRIEQLEKAISELSSSVPQKPKTTKKPEVAPEPQKPQKEQVVATQPENNPKPQKAETDNTDDAVPVDKWPEIIELLQSTCPLMAGILKSSKAYIGGGRLLIDSKLEQFKELINSDAKYRDYIRNAAEKVLGVSYNLGPYKPKEKARTNAESDPLAEFAKSINNLN